MAPTIPILPSSSAHAILSSSQKIRISSHTGNQVFSLFAFSLPTSPSRAVPSYPSSHLSMPHTRTSVMRTSVLAGDTLLSSTRTPMLSFVYDSSESKNHDTLFPACDPHRYAQLGAPKDHPSCVGNLLSEAEKVGIVVRHVPDALNLFMNVRVGGSEQAGKIKMGPTDGTRGAAVEFEAKIPVIVIVCACAMDLVPGNGEALTGGGMEIVE